MYKIRLYTEAEEELEISAIHFKRIAVELADKFLSNVETSIELIRIKPLAFQKKYKNKREVPVEEFPFVIIYEIKKDFIDVLSVYHTSRNPKKKFKRRFKK